ncbi:MAG: hypothetical protein LC624_12510 [Halobacteriales archaeon]|nr:hypothetical protein [Halobacteriales archaeon]
MADKPRLAGTAKTAEHVVTVDSLLEAAGALRDIEPSFGRPGRKLGL